MKNTRAIGFAILAAAFYALNAPLSKLLLNNVAPRMMAAFLYLGAGVGMFALTGLRKLAHQQTSEQHLTRKDLPYVLMMVALDSAAPIFLMLGLKTTAAANVSLMNNFEIVATSLIAWVFFRERITKRLWVGIGLVTLSSFLLSIEDASSFQFTTGSLFVLLACTCWGLENNCTRKMSESDPMEIVIIKGLGSGVASLAVAFAVGEQLPALSQLLLVMALGFVAYGMSVYFYVYAQRYIGAAKTSAYYAIAPFIGVALSFLFFRDAPGPLFLLALVIMVGGTWVVTVEQ